jgi:type IV pilus assembly protein PilW
MIGNNFMARYRLTIRRPTEQAGFTLIELMVGMAVSVVVVAAAFTILTTTSKSLRANEQIVDTQQNIRMAMEMLTRDFKLAGFGKPAAAVGNCTEGIVPADQNTGGVDTGPDSVQLLVPTTKASGTNRWTLRLPTTTAGTTIITLQPGAVTDMVNSGLIANSSYISIGGSATAQVTGFNASASTINVSIPPPLWFQTEDRVYLLQCIRYRVVPEPDPGNLCGIEDLQLAYACDGCTAINGGIPDGVIDDQSPASNSFDQTDFLSNVPWTTGLLTPDKIQLVQVALVARQSQNDLGFGESNSAKVGASSLTVTSDHSLPADSNHRRRILIKTVETRNVGM